MKKLFIIINLAFVSLIHAFDLNTAYKQALAYNADYLGQIESTASTEELPNLARSQLLPQITANGIYGQSYINTSGMWAIFSQPSANAQLQQVIFDFNKYSAYTKSKFAVSAARLQLSNSRQKLILDVAKSYFDVLYATDNLNAIRMNKEAFQKQLEQASASFEAGTVTKVDVNDAKASYDAAVAQELQTQNELINKKNIFKNITGLNPDLIQPLVTKINLVEPSPSSVDEWSNMAKSGNLNIKIAQLQLSMASEDIKIAKAGHLPIINLVGTYLLQGNATLTQTDSPQTTEIFSLLSTIPGVPLSSYTGAAVGLQLIVPISSGGGITSKVRQAIDNYEVADQQITTISRQTDQNIRYAYYQVLNGVSTVKAQTQALKSAKLKLDSDKVGYLVGIRNSVDLITSQKNYTQAILNYNDARYKYLNYQLQLEYLSGKISEEYLNFINNNISQ